MHPPSQSVSDLFLDRLAFWCLALKRGAVEQAPDALNGVAAAARLLAHDPSFVRALADEGLPNGLTPAQVADCLIGCLHAVDRAAAALPPVPVRPHRDTPAPALESWDPPVAGRGGGGAASRGRPRFIKPCPR